jgi:hypothetical protein
MSQLRLIPLAMMLALAACQQEKAADPSASASAAPEAKPGLAVSGGRLVLPAVKGNPAAAYFTLNNTGSAVVSVAAVSIDGAAKAEMHETKGGAMSPLAQFDVKPAETVEFAPGGKHVMAFDLSDKLAAGGTAELTITFADGDKISAPLTIEAAGGGMGGAMGAMSGMEHGDKH